jgi:hypothetical protein
VVWRWCGAGVEQQCSSSAAAVHQHESSLGIMKSFDDFFVRRLGYLVERKERNKVAS